MARTSGYRRSAVFHAALQNKSVVCSGSRVTTSTVMKLHGSDNQGWIIVKTYKEHLLTHTHTHTCHNILILLKPVLNWTNFCSPEHTSDSPNFTSFSTGLQWDASFGPNLRQTRSRQHDRKCRLKSSQVKSIYFNHPSQGNSTNYYLCHSGSPRQGCAFHKSTNKLTNSLRSEWKT